MKLKSITKLTTLLLFFVTCAGCGQTNVEPSTAIVESNEVAVSQVQTETVSSTQEFESTLDSGSSEIISEPESSSVIPETPVPTLTYIGHASVKIVTSNGTVIYIDPNYQDEYLDEADYIFVTHGHSDHTPHKNVKLAEGGTKLTYKEFLHDGIYETFDFGDVKVAAVPAANQNHDIRYCVGYLVTFDDITVYHAGDTSLVDSMSELASKNIDYALYPIDGVYNMDAIEATNVAEIVGAKNNIPIHELDRGDTLKSDNFTPAGRLIMKYGETIKLK